MRGPRRSTLRKALPAAWLLSGCFYPWISPGDHFRGDRPDVRRPPPEPEPDPATDSAETGATLTDTAANLVALCVDARDQDLVVPPLPSSVEHVACPDVETRWLVPLGGLAFWSVERGEVGCAQRVQYEVRVGGAAVASGGMACGGYYAAPAGEDVELAITAHHPAHYVLVFGAP